jgi:hypothetical protein
MVVAGAWWLVSSAGAPSAPESGAAAVTPQATVDRGPDSRSADSKNQIVVPTAEPLSSESTEPVLLLGDSLAVGIASYLDAGLGARSLTTDAAEGRNTATTTSLLGSYASTSPSTWVVSLGTNDNVDQFEQQARTVMQLAGPERCVVWFDVWREATDQSINAILQRLALENPNLHVIPWHDTAAVHPEWFSGVDVHPSTDGYAVRGQMAVDAVSRYCG